MVYKARHIHMDKIVAIKMLVQGAVNDDKSFLRFEQEARAAASLTHPNIIGIYDFGRSGQGSAYLVMEFLKGKTLEDILVDSCDFIELPRFLHIFSQVCEGMQHAHKKGIIHRDLKPSNLMLIDTEDAKDVVKIVDFGLAKLSATEQSQQHLTQTGMVMGSPPFMSPEQCRGDELDTRSDIYSLGCVMYAALTGQVPLMGNNSMATIFRHISDTPKSISEIVPHRELPSMLEEVVMKTLAKDPADRPQTMSDLGRELAAALNGFAVPSDLPSTPVSPFPATGTRPGTAPLQSTATSPDNRGFTNRTVPLSKGNGHTGTTTGGASQNLQSRSNAAAGVPSQIVAGPGMQNKSGPAITTTPAKHEGPSWKILCLVFAVSIGSVALAWQLFNAEPPKLKIKAVDSPPKTDPAASNTDAKPDDSKSGSNAGTTDRSTSAKTDDNPSSSSYRKDDDAEKQAAQDSSEPSKPRKNPQQIAAKNVNPTAAVDPAVAARLQAITRADDYRKQANKAANEKRELDARALFEQCLREEQSAYGHNSPRILPTIARILSSRTLDEKMDQEMIQDLDLALDIFKSTKQESTDVISQTQVPLSTWRPLAFSCMEMGKDSKGPAKPIYFGWSKFFYEQCVQSWSKPKDGDYKRLLHSFLFIAQKTGDKAKANQLRQELGDDAPPADPGAGNQGPDNRDGRNPANNQQNTEYQPYNYGYQPSFGQGQDSNQGQGPGGRHRRRGFLRRLQQGNYLQPGN